MNIVSKVRITSSIKTDDVIFSRMESAVNTLRRLNPAVEIDIVKRRKLTIKELFRQDHAPVIVISHHVPVLYFNADDKVFYHENTMRFKVKRLVKHGEIPPLVAAMQVKLEERLFIVDTTMGMGNDLMLMTHLLPNAEFYAYEQHLLLFYVISEGINQHFPKLSERINFCYGTVDEVTLNRSDIVYVDPMFEQTIEQQSGMQVLHEQIEMNNETLLTTITAHSDFVIMKGHYQSPLFNKFGFDVIKRNSSSHFGIKKRPREVALLSNHHADHIN